MNFLEKQFYKNDFSHFNNALRQLGAGVLGGSIVFWIQTFILGYPTIEIPVGMLSTMALTLVTIAFITDLCKKLD